MDVKVDAKAGVRVDAKADTTVGGKAGAKADAKADVISKRQQETKRGNTLRRRPFLLCHVNSVMCRAILHFDVRFFTAGCVSVPIYSVLIFTSGCVSVLPHAI